MSSNIHLFKNAGDSACAAPLFDGDMLVAANEVTAHGADWPAFELIEGDWTSGLLLICDHATNAIPPHYEHLGLPAAELKRHIAYDIGMRALTLGLAQRLGVPAVLSTFSRLLIDPNRGEDDPTALMRLSDGAVIPVNRHADAHEKERRLALYHRPYHGAVTQVIDHMIASGKPPLLISLHSFTAIWRGVPRPWHAGILWDEDGRAAKPFIDALEKPGDLVVGDNEPYKGSLTNDTMYRHGTMRGIAHALLEVRQDLVSDDKGIAQWVDRLHPILKDLMALPGINTIVKPAMGQE